MGYYIDAKMKLAMNDPKAAYEILKSGAEEGDIIASYGLAAMQIAGQYIEKNVEEGTRRIEELYPKIKELSLQGNSEAMVIVYNYHKTKGTDLNYGLAMLHKASQDENNALALFLMGAWYRDEGDLELARQYFEKAARLPNTAGIKVILANYYINYKIPNFVHDEKRGFYLIHEAAREGVVAAQYSLGELYEKGVGTEKSIDEAIKWYKCALKNGHEEASITLQLIIGRYCSENKIKSEECLLNLKELRELGCDVEFYYYRSLLANAQRTARSGSQNDLEKGVEYFNVLFELNPFYQKNYGSELADLYYHLAEIKEADECYGEATAYYTKAYDLGINKAMYNLAVIYYNGYDGRSDYSKALYFFKKCTLNGIKEGEAHYYIGTCFYWGNGVPTDFENAKKHFLLAYEYGFNCAAAITLVEAETSNDETKNSMRKYANQLKQMNLTEKERYLQIIKDLQQDFGKSWDVLKDDTKKFIATGMDIYISIYFKGAHVFGEYDFSAAISEMCKGLERELKEHLFVRYITWLKQKAIEPAEFMERNGITVQNISRNKRSVLKRISATEFDYENLEKCDKYSLGNIKMTVGQSEDKLIIDETMIDYLDSNFSKDAFDEVTRREDIKEYVCSLVDDLKTVANLYRNPAAHSRKMGCKMAEECGNYILKVKKLLIKFLEKFAY